MVESAGFEPYHVGERPDRRAITVARKNGVDISGHHARLFSVDDFDNFDMIYVMDQRNYRDVTFVARDENDKNKIDYILNLIHKFKNQTVPDPYYGNESDFELTYQLLESACDKIVAKL
ncbi:MAG: low molecular weight phosphotyrosine protein phosphatase, partial [Bacteroidales bacterium]|nr:low molecular weight phosphotyrosine protein phosphatase [Bacteroidales bacterium]